MKDSVITDSLWQLLQVTLLFNVPLNMREIIDVACTANGIFLLNPIALNCMASMKQRINSWLSSCLKLRNCFPTALMFLTISMGFTTSAS